MMQDPNAFDYVKVACRFVQAENVADCEAQVRHPQRLGHTGAIGEARRAEVDRQHICPGAITECRIDRLTAGPGTGNQDVTWPIDGRERLGRKMAAQAVLGTTRFRCLQA